MADTPLKWADGENPKDILTWALPSLSNTPKGGVAVAPTEEIRWANSNEGIKNALPSSETKQQGIFSILKSLFDFSTSSTKLNPLAQMIPLGQSIVKELATPQIPPETPLETSNLPIVDSLSPQRYGALDLVEDIKKAPNLIEKLGKIGDLPTYAGTTDQYRRNILQIAKDIVKGDYKAAATNTFNNMVLFPSGRGFNLGKGIGVLGIAYVKEAMPQESDTSPDAPIQRVNELTTKIASGLPPALLDWASHYRFVGTKLLLQPNAHILKAALKIVRQGDLAEKIPLDRINKMADDDFGNYGDYWDKTPEFAAMDVIAGLSLIIGVIEKVGMTPKVMEQVKKLPGPIRDAVVNKYQPLSTLYESPGGEVYTKGVLRAKGELSLSELEAQEAAQTATNIGATANQLATPTFDPVAVRVSKYLQKKHPILKEIPLGNPKGLAGAGNQGLIEEVGNAIIPVRAMPTNKAISAITPSIKQLLSANNLSTEGADKIAETLVRYAQKTTKITPKIIPGEVAIQRLAEITPKSGEFVTKFKEQTILNEQQLQKLYPQKVLEKAQTSAYIHRTYDPKFRPTPEGLAKVKDWLTTSGKLTPTEADGVIEAGISKKSLVTIRQGKVIQVSYSKTGLLERHNVPEVLRKELYGEVLEPSVMVYQTLKTQKDLKIMGTFYKELAENPEITVQGVDKFKVGFTKVPNDIKFGQMAGKLVRDDIVKDLYAATVETPRWLEGWRKFVGVTFKGPKTVYQISTQARNVQFDFPLAFMAGVDPTDLPMLKDVTASYLKKDNFYREVLRRGGVGGNYAEAEVMGVLKDAHKSGNVTESLGNFSRKVANIPTKAYALPDDLTKMMVIRKKLIELGGNDPARWTPEMFDTAIAHARNAVPYYDLKPPYAQFLSDTTLSPFYMFTHEMVRTMLYNSRFHPIRVAMVAETPALVNAAGMARLGVSPEEMRDLRKLMPDYMKNSLLSLVDKKDGKYYFMDLTYTMGMDNPVALTLRPKTILGGPVVGTLLQATVGKDELGRDVVKPGDNPALAHGKALARRFGPNWTPIVGTTYEKWRKVYRGEEGAEPGITFLDSAGIKIVVVDPSELRKQYRGSAKGELTALRNRLWLLNSRKGEFKGYTDAEVEKTRTALKQKYYELLREHRGNLE